MPLLPSTSQISSLVDQQASVGYRAAGAAGRGLETRRILSPKYVSFVFYFILPYQLMFI